METLATSDIETLATTVTKNVGNNGLETVVTTVTEKLWQQK